MRRIAIINQKGGVGKTTTTANLGAAFARVGKRVLLIDLDPQGHLSLHFGSEVSSEQPSMYDVLTASTPIVDAVVKLRKNISIVPADIDLAGAEAELVSVMGREVLLREAIDAYAGRPDILLIDCPPSLGVLTINALVACDEVLIPMQAHFFGLQGLSKLLETVLLVRQRINPGLRITGVVLCMHESNTRLAGEVTDDIVGFLEGARQRDVPWADARLFVTAIRRNIKLAESSSFGKTVFDYAPKSNGALDYAALAAEILGDGTKPSGAATSCARDAPTTIKDKPTPTTAGASSAPNGGSNASSSAPEEVRTSGLKQNGGTAHRDSNGRFVRRESAENPPAPRSTGAATQPARASGASGAAHGPDDANAAPRSSGAPAAPAADPDCSAGVEASGVASSARA